MPQQISADNLQPSLVTVITAGGGPKITSVAVADSSYTILDDTAVDTAGGYIVITGTGFTTGCQVIINDVLASSVTFVNSTTVRAQVGARAAGTYNVYLTNSDGGVAIAVNGLTYSALPSWNTGSTLTPAETDAFISYTFSAADATSYTLQAGSSLPPGMTLSSNGYLSGTVTGINDTTTYNFTVVAIDAQAQDSPRTFSVTISTGDAFFNYVTAFLTGDTATANANTFVIDSSTNNFTVTPAADTKPNRFSPYTPGYYSNFFDGTGDNLTFPNSSQFAFGTGSFTIEFWINAPLNNDKFILGGRGAVGTMHITTGGSSSTAGVLRYVGGSTIVSNGVITDNRWHHCAIVRNGSTNITLYVDGVSVGTGTDSTNYTTTSGTWIIGKNDTSDNNYITGYISNFRIVKGTAVYTSNFTPATAPLTAVANTSLLTCQSNRFIDVSTNNFAISRTGDVKVRSFDPFVLDSAYETYGSAYMDASGDRLTVPDNVSLRVASSDFTIEFWVYLNGNGASEAGLFRKGTTSNTNALLIYKNGANQDLIVYTNGALMQVSGAYGELIGKWTHFALTRSGSTFTLFYDGAVKRTASYGINLDNASEVQIGDSIDGYISNFRLIKGTALYTSAFTPPTTPLTPVANTSLLTAQTNEPINNNVFVDKSSHNNVVTRNGNPTQGTFSPYGENWSHFFDGTGDYLTLASNAAFGYGTGDFTIEFWLYLNTIAADQTIVSNLTSVSSTNPHLYFGISGTAIYYYTNNANRITSSAVNARQWYHVALCRSSGSTRLFINGTQSGSTYADSNDYGSSAPFGIGTYVSGGTPVTSSTLNGYISNVRILKGTALYTSNFTPSTTPLLPVANTSLLTCNEYNFADYSPNRLTISRFGDVAVQKLSPFATTLLTTPYYSTYFDGTGDYLTVPNTNNVFNFGTGDFTIEANVYLNVMPAGNGYPNSFWIFGGGQSNSDIGFDFAIGSTNIQVALANFATLNINASHGMTTRTWYHLALVRNGNTLSLYKDGTLLSTVPVTGVTADPMVSGVSISAAEPVGATSGNLNGYISNLRVLKGTALYTSAFTPPTAPLSTIANTSLLIARSNTHIDLSNNNLVITVVGNSVPTLFSPFTPTYATKQNYSTSTLGGSMFFDGTGDYLTIGNNLSVGANNFTVQAWVHPTAWTVEWNSIVSTRPTASTGGRTDVFVLGVHNSGYPYIYSGDFQVTGTANTVPLRSWTHLCVTRSGSTMRLFVNGALANSTTSLQNYTAANGAIGSNINGSEQWTGYLSDVSLTGGEAIYTSSFVPPLSTMTPVNNTLLMLTGTDAVITDASIKNDYETVGDVKLNTSTKKYGNSSIQFDGTGDYLVTPANNIMQFGTSNFTIEMWWNPSTLASFQPLIYHTNDSGVNGTGEFSFLYNTTLGLRFYINGGATAIQQGSTTGWSTGTWYHVAAVRNGNTLTLYRDGVSIASGSVSGVTIGALVPTHIGGDPYNPASITGFIDDFRVTNGVARYTANFTPPTKLPLK